MIDARIRKILRDGRNAAVFELDVQLSGAPGITVLFGPSGAGKSLTLDCIAGFARPDSGRILVNDRIVFDAAAGVNLRPRERGCGCVFQSGALFPHLSLIENLWFAAVRHPRRVRRRKVREMLERFHLEELSSRLPHELSGGQRQRGSIARALLAQPAALLLDEPARGLDAPLRAEFHALLLEVREQFGLPVVLVTHSLDEALELGDLLYVLMDGKIVQSGAPGAVLDAPASAAVARLMACYNLLRAELVALDPAARRSRLRIRCEDGTEFEILGPYFPGLLLGANITLAIREDELEAGPDLPGGVKLEFLRMTGFSRGARAELRGGLRAALPAPVELEQTRNWSVRFPSQSLRLVKP